MDDIDLRRQQQKVTKKKDYSIEKEMKFVVDDIFGVLNKLTQFAKHKKTIFIRDVIYGQKDKKNKVRLRLYHSFDFEYVQVEKKNRIKSKNNE